MKRRFDIAEKIGLSQPLDFSKVMRRWESTGVMDDAAIADVEDKFDELMTSELTTIEKTKDSELAFARMMRLTNLLNGLIIKRPSIINKLQKWINKLKNALSNLAKQIGAKGFAITVGIPFGISVTLEF